MYTMDIAPKKGNPRNSEGAFFQISSDSLLFVYSAFRGDSARDYTDADIMAIRSNDGGQTWLKPVLVTSASEYHAMNVMSVSLLSMENGDIGLFYLVRISWTDMYIVLQRSSDQGKTWSAPTKCSPRKGYYVMNNDRVVRTASGRIILPVAEHDNKIDGNGKVLFAPAQTIFFYSDDDGVSWHEAPTKLTLNVPVSHAGLQEPGVIEAEPGQLYGWARTDIGRQYEFWSYDNGIHWSEAVPSRFTSPLSPLSMKKLHHGEWMAIWNPIPPNNLTKENYATGDRSPLACAISTDQGKNWSEPILIEDDPDCGYCYTAIWEMDDCILLAYCAGSEEDFGSCLNRLRIRRLSINRNTNLEENQQHCMGIGFS